MWPALRRVGLGRRCPCFGRIRRRRRPHREGVESGARARARPRPALPSKIRPRHPDCGRRRRLLSTGARRAVIASGLHVAHLPTTGLAQAPDSAIVRLSLSCLLFAIFITMRLVPDLFKCPLRRHHRLQQSRAIASIGGLVRREPLLTSLVHHIPMVCRSARCLNKRPTNGSNFTFAVAGSPRSELLCLRSTRAHALQSDCTILSLSSAPNSFRFFRHPVEAASSDISSSALLGFFFRPLEVVPHRVYPRKVLLLLRVLRQDRFIFLRLNGNNNKRCSSPPMTPSSSSSSYHTRRLVLLFGGGGGVLWRRPAGRFRWIASSSSSLSSNNLPTSTGACCWSLSSSESDSPKMSLMSAILLGAAPGAGLAAGFGGA